jgi:hypothetical protein
VRRALGLALLLILALAGTAAACPSCLSSAYGDRTFNWAFLILLLMPFVVSAAIGGVLLYTYRPFRTRRVTRPHSLEETT